MKMSRSLAARIVAVGGMTKPDHARSTLRMFASARDDAVRARLVRANRRAAWTRRRAPTIVTAALPRDDDGERREISRRGPDGSRAGGYPNPAPGTLRKKQNAKDVTRDGIAATAVMYAFAAWQWLQWPAGTPHPSFVPAPFHAACVAAAAGRADRAGARGGGAPGRQLRSQVSQNISQPSPYISPLPYVPSHTEPSADSPRPRPFPLDTGGRFSSEPRSGPEAARAMTSARRFVYSTFAAVNFSSAPRRFTSSPPSSRPRRRWLGTARGHPRRATSPPGCFNRGDWRDTARALLVRGGGAFVVITALFAAKHALFGGVDVTVPVTAAASKAASIAAAKIAAAAPPVAPSLDIAAGLVGVWIVLAGAVLDAAADDTVGAAVDASRTGRPLRPAKDRAWESAARLPVAAAFAAFAVATCLNPAANLPPRAQGCDSRGGCASGSARGGRSTPPRPCSAARPRRPSPRLTSRCAAGILSVVSMGLPANAMGSAGAAFGACLFAAGAAAIAPALGVVAADYFVLRRVVDTNLLVDDASNRPGGSFWFWNGFNPRAVLAWGVGAAFPAAEFASACVAGGSVAAELAAGSVGGALVAPGLALARGATLGAAVSSAMYLAFNKLAPPSRAGGYTRGVQGGMYARGGAWAPSPPTAARRSSTRHRAGG